MTRRVIAVLLRIYPAAWRAEYGPELQGVLEARPLTARTVANVACHGAWQRLRATEPWVLMGVPIMLFTFVLVGLSIVVPPPYSPAQDPGHLPTSVGLTLTAIWISLTVGCGLWTVLRGGGTLPHAGLQTMKMGLLRGVPAFVVSFLILTGALGVIVIGPGDLPTTFAEHGFAITFASAEGVAPNAWLLLLMPLGGMIDCWLFGAIGGAIGRAIAVGRHHPAS